MARPDRLEWSQEIAGHGGGRRGSIHRSITATHAERPLAQLQPGERKKLHQVKDELLDHNKRPSSGRTSALGRKVEKPGPIKQSGPSGQTDGVQHDRKHANK